MHAKYTQEGLRTFKVHWLQGRLPPLNVLGEVAIKALFSAGRLS